MLNQAILRYQQWFENLHDEKFKLQLQRLTPEQIQLQFANELAFGTAGVRAKLGLGSNLLNNFTITKLTLAYFQYLLTQYNHHQLKTNGIVVFHDNRLYSLEFSQLVANILTDLNVKVFLSSNNELQPTPFLSFCIRELKAVGGVMITASHNPKEYNGFKVYNEFGAQPLETVTSAIQAELNKILPKYVFQTIYKGHSGLISFVPTNLEHHYVELIKAIPIYKHHPKQLKVVYTCQNGTANKFLQALFASSGYQVIPVQEQCLPDSQFSATTNANPEFLESFDLAIKYAKTHQADVIISTDPDADRLGICYRTPTGEYALLTGNQTAYLLLAHYLPYWTAINKKPQHYSVYSTYVSSDLVKKMCEAYHVNYKAFPTGFKNIANEIIHNHQSEFVFGYEEAIGFLMKPIVFDKDGIQTALIMVDLFNYLKINNQSVPSALTEIFQKFGNVHEHVFSLNLPVSLNNELTAKFMQYLRLQTINQIADLKLTKKTDYLRSEFKPYTTDLLRFNFNQQDWFAIRPSGTEPKIKIYIYIYDQTQSAVEHNIQVITQACQALLKQLNSVKAK